MKLFPFPTANRHVPFDSEDVDVKAASTTDRATSKQRLMIRPVEAARKVVSSLDGAWGTVGAIYGACASKAHVVSAFAPFTTAATCPSSHQPASLSGFDRRESLPSDPSLGNTTHHVAERFIIKLEYLLDHPSTVNYMLSGPDSHAAGFAELWTSRSVHIKEDKRYKTRCEMLYDAAMSPLIEATVMKRYEQLKQDETAAAVASVAAGGGEGEELDDSAIFIKAVQQSKKVPDCLWVRLWYSFFLALRNNGGQRLRALAILNKGIANDQAGDVVVVDEEDDKKTTSSTDPCTATPPTTSTPSNTCNWNSLSKAETDALTTGLQEAAIALSNIVEELEEICPQLTGKKMTTSGGDGGVSSVEEEEVTLESLFQSAQKAFGKVADKYSNDIKLRFYGLFKQATVGDINTKRPWGFDMAGKAKWDAWSKEKGLSKEEAMQTYVEEWDNKKM